MTRSKGNIQYHLYSEHNFTWTLREWLLIQLRFIPPVSKIILHNMFGPVHLIVRVYNTRSFWTAKPRDLLIHLCILLKNNKVNVIDLDICPTFRYYMY